MSTQGFASGTKTSLWIPIRDKHTNKLLFRYDPLRQLVEISERGKTSVVDLVTEAEAFYQQSQSVPNAS